MADRPTPTWAAKEGHGVRVRTSLVAFGVVAIAFLGLIILGAVVGQPPPKPPEGIDPRLCEFVLTPHRDSTFMRCPVPDGVRIPNWPDKPAPLNER